MNPEIGLKLFTEGQRRDASDIGFNPNPQIDMTADAVITFLDQMQEIAPKKDSGKLELTFKQRYLLKLCELPNTPEKYFTDLGTSLVDSLYVEYNRSQKDFNARDRKYILSPNFFYSKM